MGHLMRRAGFGATRDELDERLARGYEATVNDLLNPSTDSGVPEDLLFRYHVDQAELRIIESMGGYWMYHLSTTECPLQEKMTLFWHHLFATGEMKVQQGKTMTHQVEMFRRNALGSFRDILVALSKDPAMLFWLDNNDNHDGAVNENYGRELLELFAMGVGNYTEQDVKEASRAFTGWTVQNEEYMSLRTHKASIWPYGKIAWQFEYRDDDHDKGQKEFLGETGNFNGEDIVDIVVRQPATARFLCTRLYQFFVADEVGRDGAKLVEELTAEYFRSQYDLRSVLRKLFLSDHFKSEVVRFRRYKSPAELVAGTLRLARSVEWPGLHVREAAMAASYMGQQLLNPPSVEGWHEGAEWIDSGALVERVNFASAYFGDTANPGVRDIIERLERMDSGVLGPEEAVDACAEMVGPVRLEPSTRRSLVARVAGEGPIVLQDGPGGNGERRVTELLELVAGTREYQLA